jgi:hypothetical protein
VTFLTIVLFVLQLAASEHRLTFLPIVLFVLQLAASDHRLTFLPIVLSILLQFSQTSEQLQKQIKKYHTVGTVTKTNRKIPHCRNSYKKIRKIPQLFYPLYYLSFFSLLLLTTV